MQLLNEEALQAHIARHPEAAAQITTLRERLRQLSATLPNQITEQFAKASTFKRGRVLFRLGNGHRVVCQLDYPTQICVVIWVGTHDEYDTIDPETVQPR